MLRRAATAVPSAARKSVEPVLTRRTQVSRVNLGRMRSNIVEAAEQGAAGARMVQVDVRHHELPNVLMTPHLGGSSRENLLRIGDSVDVTVDLKAKRISGPPVVLKQ